ncbi:helix-turn-helix transcriptional regulator [Micromonospora sp. NPDC050795]|uniref:helix-turn-helix transcriptional regulator n=1 Tax=Micromonospora sp. NPDC050795 TaxID=3364282 RepID=UPI00379EE0CA
MLAVTLPSRSIADRLGLSVNTVNNNLARVFTKLGVRNRKELAVVLGHDQPAVLSRSPVALHRPQ